jgi:hypothetical protein
MKKLLICLCVLFIGTGSALYSDTQFRLAGSGAIDFVGKPKLETVKLALDEGVSPFYGFQWEVLFSHFGFGMNYLVKFENLDRDWFLDWQGIMFISYHIFMPDFFLDPFIEVGIGNAGRVDLIGSNVAAAAGDVPGLNLSLYPHLAAGLGFRLDRFIIGGKLGYRPFVERIPVAPISSYPLKNLQFGIFAGVVFG